MNPLPSQLSPDSLLAPPVTASALPKPPPEACTFCKEPLFNGRSVVLLPCQHRFHIACNETWADGHQLGDWTCRICGATPTTLDTVGLSDDRYATLADCTENLKLRLFKACQDGNLATVTSAVEEDPSVITGKIQLEGRKGHYEPIHVAALYGHVPIVGFLLDRGADVNAPFEAGKLSPIELAAREGHAELVEYLIGRGAKNLDLALRLSTRKGFCDVVQKLTDHGADVNFVHEFNYGDKVIGFTPLTFSVASESAAQLIELLISQGARVTGASLWLAAELGKIDIVKLLIALKADVNDLDGWIICTAARSNRLEVVRELLANGAEIDKAEGTQTALGYAAEHGCVDMIHLLADAGASPGPRVLSNGKSSRSPLCIAAYAGQNDSIKALIEHGAGVDIADYRGATPLTEAIRAENIALVRELVGRYKASVNNQAEIFIPLPAMPMSHEFFGGRQQIVLSPLAFAMLIDANPIIHFLIDAGADVNALQGLALRLAIMKENAGAVSKLIGSGADLRRAFDNGEMPLALATRLKHRAIVMELLRHRAPLSEISLPQDLRNSGVD